MRKMLVAFFLVVTTIFCNQSSVWANLTAQTGILAPTSPSGNVYALVVGINDYYPLGTGGPDLQFCVNDARDMMRALIDVYNVPHGSYKNTSPSGKYGNIRLLLNGHATKSAILSALSSLGSKKDDDIVIFFSGHGTASILDQDGDPENKDNGYVVNGATGREVLWDGELKNALASISARRVIVLGDFSWPSGFNSDLKQLDNVLYIAGAKGEAFEDKKIQNGVFTEKFVNLAIRSGYADDPVKNPHATPDGVVTFEEAYDYANHVKISGVVGSKPNIVDNLANDVLIKKMAKPLARTSEKAILYRTTGDQPQ